MKRLILCLSLFTLLAASTAVAQEPVAPLVPDEPDWAQITNSPSEEMWFYLQEMRRYDDPVQAVRRNAEFRAAQRRTRIAMLKWIGYSKQRPTAQVTPFTSYYSPTFLSPVYADAKRVDLYRWVGGGVPTTASVESDTIRR